MKRALAAVACFLGGFVGGLTLAKTVPPPSPAAEMPACACALACEGSRCRCRTLDPSPSCEPLCGAFCAD